MSAGPALMLTHGQNRVWYIGAGNKMKLWVFLWAIETRHFWIRRKKIRRGKTCFFWHLIMVTFYCSSANSSLALTHNWYNYAHYLSYATLVSSVAFLQGMLFPLPENNIAYNTATELTKVNNNGQCQVQKKILSPVGFSRWLIDITKVSTNCQRLCTQTSFAHIWLNFAIPYTVPLHK